MSSFDRAFKELNSIQLSILKTMSCNRLVACMLPRQTGKTHLGVWVLKEVMMQNDNAQTLFLAKDGPSVIRATRDKILKIFPTKQFNTRGDTITHNYTTQAKGRGALFTSGVDKMPDKLRGGTMAQIHWSEVAFSKFEGGVDFTTVLQQVLLPMIAKTRGGIYLESTPKGKNFWYKFWKEDTSFKKIKFPLELCIELGVISLEEVQFFHKTMHPDVFRQEMECEFVSFSGKIYSDLSDKNLLIVDPPRLGEKIICGVDIGFTGSNSSCLFGIWRNNKLEVFDQIYIAGRRHDELAMLIKAKLISYDVDLVDILCFCDHHQDLIDELLRLGVPSVKVEKRDTFAQRLYAKELLYKREIIINPLRCEKLLLELDSCVWDDKKMNDMDYAGDPNSGHYDSEASFRYLLRGYKYLTRHVDKESP